MRPLSLLLIGMVLGCAPRIQYDPYEVPPRAPPSWVDSSLDQKLDDSKEAFFEEMYRTQVGCRLVVVDLPSPRAVRAFRDKFVPIHGQNYHMASAVFEDCRVEDVLAEMSQVPEASYFKTPVASYAGRWERGPTVRSRYAIGFDDERGMYWNIRITDWVAQRALIWFSAQGRSVTDSDSPEPLETWNVTEHVSLARGMLSIHLAESEDGNEGTAILVELVQLHEYPPGSNEFARGE